MIENQPRLCGSCLYWQSYPTLKGVGICDHPVSRYYQRGVMDSAEPCECFVLAKTGVSLGDPEVLGTSPGQEASHLVQPSRAAFTPDRASNG